MGYWIREDDQVSLSTAGTDDATSIYSNLNNYDETIVDGFITLVTDTDNLVFVQLVGPVSTLVSVSDLTNTFPAGGDPMIWQRYYVQRGPLVFRIRSKRTFRHDEELFLHTAKVQGGDATLIHIGYQLYVQPHGR